MNLKSIKKDCIGNQDVFLLLWKIKYIKRKDFTWVTFSRLQAKLPSGFIPASSLQQELLPCLTPWWHKGWMITNTQGNKSFLCKWEKCRRHKGLQTWSRENLSIIILLSLLSPSSAIPHCQYHVYHHISYICPLFVSVWEGPHWLLSRGSCPYQRRHLALRTSLEPQPGPIFIIGRSPCAQHRSVSWVFDWVVSLVFDVSLHYYTHGFL